MLNNSRLIDIKHYTLGLLLLLLYLSDFISKLGFIYNSIFQYSSVITKFILQVFLIVFVLVNKNTKSIEILKYIGILFLIFIIGNLALKNTDNLLKNLFANLKVFDWYIFIFLLFAAYYTLNVEQKQKQLPNLFLMFKTIFCLNTFFIIIGLITNIQIFSSYYYGQRFGFNGLLRNATHASYIYMIFISYFYYNFKRYRTKPNLYLLILSIIFSLVIGTKALFLFNILFFIYLLFSFNKKLIFPFIGFLTIVIIVCFDFIIHYILNNYSHILYQVYIDRGLFTMLFSGRNDSIYAHLIPFLTNKWSIINVFFGGASFNLFRTEFELIDFLWFFGFFGTLVYFYIWNKFILNFKELKNNKLLIFQIIITILAGSYFSSVPVTTMLFVYILFILNNQHTGDVF